MTAAQLARLARLLSGAPLGVGMGFALGTGNRGAIVSFAVYVVLQLVSLGADFKEGLRLDAEIKRSRAELDAALRKAGV